MNLRFVTDVPSKIFDDFVTKFSNTNFMQTSSWGKVKIEWQQDLVAVYDDNKIVATAMILKRKVFLNKTLIYIPRGFVIDYSNIDILRFLTENLRKYAKKNNAFVVKIDPFLAFNQYKYSTKNGEKINLTTEISKDTEEIHKILINLGFKHGGYKKSVNAYIQPRYTMVIPLFNENGNLTEEELKRGFPKNTRNYIGEYQEKRGVTFFYSKDKRDISKLVDLLSCTEKRQNIKLRSQAYFSRIMENFKEATLFFCEIDFNKYLSFLNEDIKTNPSKRSFCEEKIKEASILKEKYGPTAIMGATIVIMPTCQAGTKIASFLYAGTNTEILPCLKATNGLMFYRLCYALKNKCNYCDMGGVDGSLSDHLSTFKLKFNPDVVELVGEYNLIINKLLYVLFDLALKIKKHF